MVFLMGYDKCYVLNIVITILICFVELSLAIIGIFGHVIILLATYKTKKIQTKYGLLLVQLSVTHLICIAGELMNIAFIVSSIVMNEMTCFVIFVTFLVATIWQSVIMLAISIDLLCAIVFPISYRKWMPQGTVPITIALCAVLSLTYIVFVYKDIDVNESGGCNAFSITTNVSSSMNILQYCILSSEVLIYVICYVIMYTRAKLFTYRNKNACYRNQHRTTMRTISVLATIYVCTWVLAVVTSHLVGFFTDNSWKRWTWMVVSSLQMACFSQTFIVCYQRSSEYRSIFRDLLKPFKIHHRVKCQWLHSSCSENRRSKSVFFIVT